MGTRDPGPETGTGAVMGVRPRVATVFCGSAGSCRCVLQDSSTVNRRPVPHKSASACRYKCQMQQKTSICRSQPCFAVVEIFFGVKENHVEVASAHPTPWSNTMAADGKAKCGCGGADANPRALPAGRELTAGSLGKSRVYTAEDPGFFSPKAIWQPSGPRPKGKVQQRPVLNPGPRWPRRV